MLDDIKKSINSVIYERVRSPLFGTFAISWVFWNWRIFYITLFVSEKIIPNKLDFIHKYLYNGWHLFWYPVFSTIIILTVLQFINNGAYWLNLKFKKWRIEQRNEIEMKQLLTIEQSILLREQIKNQIDVFQKINDEKDNENKILKIELESIKKTIKSPEKSFNIPAEEKPEVNSENKELKEFNKLFPNGSHINEFKQIIDFIDNNKRIREVYADKLIIDFFEINKLIARTSMSYDLYELTDLGKEMYKIIINQEFGIN